MNTNPEITFGTRIRKSPYFDSPIKWGVKALTIYNRMFMPTYYKRKENIAEGYSIEINDNLLGVKICKLPFLRNK